MENIGGMTVLSCLTNMKNVLPLRRREGVKEIRKQNSIVTLRHSDTKVLVMQKIRTKALFESRCKVARNRRQCLFIMHYSHAAHKSNPYPSTPPPKFKVLRYFITCHNVFVSRAITILKFSNPQPVQEPHWTPPPKSFSAVPLWFFPEAR